LAPPFVCLSFSSMTRPPLRSPLFPYTTLFRSRIAGELPHRFRRAERLLDALDAQLGLVGAVRRRQRIPLVHERRDLAGVEVLQRDRKSTRLNSSHVEISYAVFCLKKKRCTKER